MSIGTKKRLGGWARRYVLPTMLAVFVTTVLVAVAFDDILAYLSELTHEWAERAAQAERA